MTQRAAGYGRVSDASQVETYSLDAQRGALERYCRQHDLELVRIYSDEGLSARSDQIAKRPQLAALLDDAKAGAFDLVVVHTLDRWARNVGVQRQALQQLGQAGVGFVSVTEQFDFSTPAGRLMLTMLGGVAEFFSDQLGVHVAKGQRERAAQGLSVGSIPWGYLPGEPPTVVEAEATAVHEVFARRAAGESNGSIATWLNAEGHRSRRGNVFTAHAVKDMLRMRFYTGLVAYRDEEFEGRHAAIVDEGLWERVQRRRHPHAARRARPAAEAALRGRVACAACGHPLHCETNAGGHVMYRERHACECPTDGRAVSAKRIDAAVGEIFAAIDLRPDWQQRVAGLATKRAGGEDVAALHARRRRVARAYADGGLDEPDYEQRLAELDGRIAAASAVEVPELEAVVALCGDLGQLWECATPAERQLLVEPLVDRAYVDLATKQLARVAPAPAFRSLIEVAARRTRRYREAVELVG